MTPEQEGLLSHLPTKSGVHRDPDFLKGREPYYVQFQRGRSAEIEQAVRAQGGEVTHRLDIVDAVAVLLPPAAVAALSRQAHVTLVEPVPEHRLASQVVPWNIDQFQARDIWDKNRDGIVDAGAPDGTGMKFCIIDTGYFAAHDDFQGITASGLSQINGEQWFEDGNGHGTHVAGTANAVNNSIGVVGVMPGGIEFFIVKIFNNAGSWVTGQSNLGTAAQACRDAGANVISMSLGGGSSATENSIFQGLYDNNNILNIAAAGNDGNNTRSYPASYDSVISVGAIDENELAADFTQYPTTSYDPNNPPVNAHWDVVELSGGGVQVLSTVPAPNGSVPTYTATADAVTYNGAHIEGAAFGTVSGPLVSGGLCTTGSGNASWNNAVVLCERGSVNFSEKINEVRARGGRAALLYNNVPGSFAGTCNGACTQPSIPALSLSQADGQTLLAGSLGSATDVVADNGSSCGTCTGGYDYFSGTSMATPGVAAGMALAWNACGGPAAITNKDIRQLLRASAKDLTGTHPGTGPAYGAGWDPVTGWGLVKLADAQALGHQLFGSVCPLGLNIDPPQAELCGLDGSADFTVTLDDQFLGSATLSSSGLPAGTSGGFGVNPVVHPVKQSVFTLSGLGGLASGAYGFTLFATDDADATNNAEGNVDFNLYANLPTQSSLTSPASAAVDVPLRPTFSWSAATHGASYVLEVSTSSSFASIAYTATVNGTSHTPGVDLAAGTQYYWRVRASNACGTGIDSASASFTTVSMMCTVVNSADVPRAINDATGNPNNPTPAVTNSVLTSALTGNLMDVDVLGLVGTHTWINDLAFDLISPAGTIVRIMGRSCAAEDNFGLNLDDSAAGAAGGWPCPPVGGGTYRPSNPLSAFNTQAANGTWTLRITDFAKDDVGTLQGWGLRLCVEGVAPTTYTVTPSAGAGGVIDPSTPQTVNEGAAAAFTLTPEIGYSIGTVGGSCGGSLAGNTYTTAAVTADCTVEASFTLNSYSLTYTTDGNGTISGDANQIVNHGGSGTAVTAVPNGGYSFVSWSDASTVNPRTDSNVTGPIAVTATFSQDPINGVCGASDGGTFTSAPIDNLCSAGNATAVMGSGPWTWSCEGIAGGTTAACSANIQTYSLTYTTDGNGTISGDANQIVNHGGSGTAVTAVPNGGYSFVSWSDASTVNPRTDSGVTGDITVEAQFELNPPVAFTPGNVVVYRVGDGSGALGSAATRVFLDEIDSATGDLVQSVPLPTDAVDANNRCTANGTATAEGMLSRSADRAYLVGGCYDQSLGGTASAGTRVVFRVDGDAAVDTTTALADITSGAPRTAASSNGDALWLAGNSFTRYANHGDTSSAQLNTLNTRVAQIFDGQLYVATQTRINAVGEGLPTSGTQSTSVVLEVAGGSIYGFYFADLSETEAGLDTLYVAHDNTNAISKYSKVDGVWVLNNSVGTSSAYRGLTGQVNADNSVTLYATRTGAPAGLYELVDTAGYNAANNGTPVLLHEAGANTAFRGVAFAPEAAVSFTVTASSDGNGTITPASQSVAYGGTANFTVTPTAGYHVASVTGDTCSPMDNGDGAWSASNIIAGCAVSATFAINTYTVTFQDWDGTELSVQTVNHGAAATAPADPIREGHTFTGWSAAFDNIVADLTVTAQYAINTYTVTFQDWDGAELSVQTVNHGAAATAPADPIREGHTFSGWSAAFDNITADLTVTAQYAINTYTVTFQDWDGAELSVQTVNHGAAATAPADPIREGHTFSGWSAAFDNITADLTVTAQYAINTYTVTFQDWDGAELSVQTVNHGAAAMAPADPIREGHTFSGWSAAFDNITADLTVTAQYAINSYTLTYSAGANGSIDGPALQTVEHGSDGAQVTAVPEQGYVFVEWSDGSSSNPRIDLDVQGDIAVAASFELEFAVSSTSITAINPSATQTVGQSYSVSVQVQGDSPTGQVTVSDGQEQCSLMLDAGGLGSCDLVSTSAGAKSIIASYVGDANNAASVSAPLSYTIARIETSIGSLNASSGSGLIRVGDSVTFTWALSAESEFGTLEGNVSVGNGTDQCSAGWSVGSCTTTVTIEGSVDFNYAYPGNAWYAPSQNMLTVEVLGAIGDPTIDASVTNTVQDSLVMLEDAGDWLTLEILVQNTGPNPVVGASLLVALPEAFSTAPGDTLWDCHVLGDESQSCGTGTDFIDELVDLGVGEGRRYVLTGMIPVMQPGAVVRVDAALDLGEAGERLDTAIYQRCTASNMQADEFDGDMRPHLCVYRAGFEAAEN